jgi:hypothetical protein
MKKFVLGLLLAVFGLAVSSSAQVVGSTTLTVTGVSDTNLVLACPGGINVGPNAGTCTAKGNNSGNPYTATWTSSNTGLVTINSSSGVLAGVANGTCGPSPACISATSGSLSGAFGTIIVSTPSASGFLPGAIVTSDNVNGALSTVSVTGGFPAGWTLRWARGFEGAINGNEGAYPAGNSATVIANSSNPDCLAHTGTHSAGATYFGNGNIIGWGINPGLIGNFGINWTEVDISYWDCVSNQALYGNSDYYLGGIQSNNGCADPGNPIQDVTLDAQFFGNVATTASETSEYFMVGGVGSTTNTTCMGFFNYEKGFTLNINAGVWRQYEIHIKPSTTVTNTTCFQPGNADQNNCSGNGELEVYVNGSLVTQILNADLNGSSNLGDPAAYAGGVLTDVTPDGSNTPGCSPFTHCPGPAPGAGAPPAFNRYIDDFIVITR